MGFVLALGYQRILMKKQERKMCNQNDCISCCYFLHLHRKCIFAIQVLLITYNRRHLGKINGCRKLFNTAIWSNSFQRNVFQCSDNMDTDYIIRLFYSILFWILDLYKWNDVLFSAPPDKPVIRDGNGNKLTKILGPYKIGDKISAECSTTGGKWRVLYYFHPL